MTQPAPMPENEHERLAALHALSILDTPPEARFDRLCHLACRHFGMPVALISLVDKDRQWFKARCGLDATETPRDIAFCAHAILQDGVLQVPDATQDSRFRDNELVTGDSHIRFYAGAPLVTSDGARLGTFCLIDREPRDPLNADEIADLEDFAALAIDGIESNARAVSQLAGREFLSVVLENVADGIVACDAEGTLTYFNAATRRFHGISQEDLPPEQWAGRYDLYGADGESPLDTDEIPLFRALHGEDVTDQEIVIAPKDLPARHVISNGRAIHDEAGNKLGAVVSMHDISRERKATDALRRQSYELQLVLDNIPTLVLYKDDENRILRANAAAAEFFGLSIDDAQGVRTEDVLPDLAEKYLQDDLEVINSGKPKLGIVEEYAFADGRRGWVSTDRVPFVDPNTGERFVFVAATDITKIKEAQERLRKGEQALLRQKAELDLILNNVPTRIWYKDDKNRILRLNQPAAESMGLTVAEAEGADTYDLFPEMAAKYHKDDLATIEGGKPVLGIVEEYTPKGGERGWVRTDKVPYIDPETGERFLFVAATDITDIKLAEEKLRNNEARYRALYKHTPVMMHSIDNEGRLLHVSDYWLKTLCYERHEVIGRMSTEFLTEESREHALEVVLPRFQREGHCTDVEYQFIRKDGGIIDVLLSAVAEYDTVSAKPYSLAVMVDVTEQRKLERQLVQAQKMEAVGQLTGGMAHDFNNLLAVVLGNLQLLERSVSGDEKAMRRTASAIEAAQRGAELTQRLLAFSRRQTLQAEVVDPNDLITHMAELLRRSIGEMIELDLDLASDVWHTKVDPNQLETALLNLAVNARDAMPDGGHLMIETRTATLDKAYAGSHTEVSPGDYVVVAVSDTGFGMSEDVRQKVFEPFFSTKETGKGTGLGLSMVYGFTKQTGGHVEIYSEEGSGTTVRLYLPRERSGSAARCAASTPADMPSGTETVLVVEDNPGVRDVAVSLLDDLGYQIVEAENGPEALRVLDARDDIDLLFTDMVMPGGMNGSEVAVSALARRPGLKILYTTGFAEASVVRLGELHANAAILTKPYMQPELARAVRDALDGQIDPALPRKRAS